MAQSEKDRPIALFLRLIVERNRDAISLQKALGFTGGEIGCTYCLKGFLSAVAGIISGLLLGTLLGEDLCGIVLKSFGADSFRFIIRWDRLLVGIPAIILGTTILLLPNKNIGNLVMLKESGDFIRRML